MTEQVILVDEHDRAHGTAPKLEAHRRGVLHRAFSVFVVDRAGRLLLQQRARHKYHSGGRWTNTCCGHPRPGEGVGAAAERRLREEMGFVCALRPVGRFVYRAAVGADLIEHELDHVFVGRFDGQPRPAVAEARGWRWVRLEDVRRELVNRPSQFTVWFGPALAVATPHLHAERAADREEDT